MKDPKLTKIDESYNQLMEAWKCFNFVIDSEQTKIETIYTSNETKDVLKKINDQLSTLAIEFKDGISWPDEFIGMDD